MGPVTPCTRPRKTCGRFWVGVLRRQPPRGPCQIQYAAWAPGRKSRGRPSAIPARNRSGLPAAAGGSSKGVWVGTVAAGGGAWLPGPGTFEGAADKLREIADDDLKKAREEASQVRLTDSAAERNKFAGAAEGKIDKSIQAVKDMIAKVPQQVEAARKARALADIADKQAQLADQKKNAQ